MHARPAIRSAKGVGWALGSVLALALVTASCRQVLGIDELPPGSLAADASVDAGADGAGANPDPAWARWRVPVDVSPRYEPGAGTVRDPVTGLLWQRASGPSTVWSSARADCEELSFDGQRGFRLPTRIELLSIVDYDRAEPSMFSSYFLREENAQCYWTISSEPDRISHWAFLPGYGKLAMLLRDSQKCASRCVQGGAYDYEHNVPPEYVIEDGVVRDPETRLEWQGRDASQMGQLVSLASAERECEELELLGHTDWRLPTVKELETLIDERRSHPALDPRVGGASDVYWSSTPQAPFVQAHDDAGASKLAWRVSFIDGTTEHADDGEFFTAGIALVRCVRDY